MKLAGWGRFPTVEANLRIVATAADAVRLVQHSDSVIARGNGRSYGDAALNAGLVANVLPLDRMRVFDVAVGLIECEAGVMLADLIAALVPRGWFMPVVPGTKFVTVGGMIAADVHGKNHHMVGSFGNFVDSLELLVADGTVIRCSRTSHAELFEATIGGMGLTGIILSARFRLIPIETSWIRQETVVAPNLDALMNAFEARRAATYAVAWIDSFATQKSLGRGLLYLGEHMRAGELPSSSAERPLELRAVRRRRVPFDFPAWWLNGLSMRAFNGLLYANGRRTAGMAAIGLDKYFFPLDAILEWNRIYGRRGFCQYQCVLPLHSSRSGLRRILEKVATAGCSSFLSVLKLLGPGRGMLSFPMEGYTLALDFPMSRATLALMDEFDRIVAECGGRIYLAKDSRANPEAISNGYPDLSTFRRARAAVGAGGKFQSHLSQRLEI